MNVIYILLLFLGLITPFSPSTVVINRITFVILLFDLLEFGKSKTADCHRFNFLRQLMDRTLNLRNDKWLVRIVLGLMFLQIVNFAVVDGKNLRQQIKMVPKPAFMTDMSSYLSTYYRVKRGEEFYKAFETDIRGRLSGNLPGEIWGWKQPLIFYIWKFLAGSGGEIQFLAMAIFCLDLFLIYKILEKFVSKKKALLGPFLVLPYFHYPLVEMTLIQVEWWALSFFIVSLYFYVYEKKWEAGIFFALTLAVRELFAIPIIFVVLNEVLKQVFYGNKKNWKGFVKLIIPTVVFFLPYYYFIHFKNILRFENLETLISNSGRRQYEGGWELVRTTLAYGSWSYVVAQFRPFLILLGLNSLVLGWRIIKDKKNRWDWFLILGLFLPFFLLSFKIGIIDVWHDYWGICYVPMLLMTTPIIVSSKLKTQNLIL